MLEFVVNSLFVLLVGSVAAWAVIYYRYNPTDSKASPYYRYHQVLIALIALLAILLAVVVVLSSDPGNPEDFWFDP